MKKLIYLILIIGVFVFIFVSKQDSTPETLNLAVPFTVQALNNNWTRNKDCEEASIAMANAYLSGNRDEVLQPDVAQKYIDAVKQWEAVNTASNANTGNEDTGAYATSDMAKGTFGIKVKQIRDYTESDLKQALVQGHVILLPINARLLGNPTYQESGPFYHMLVVRGYDTNGDFIVNDPGTNQGNGQIYSFSTLYKASGDWNNQSQGIDSTIKIAIILSK